MTRRTTKIDDDLHGDVSRVETEGGGTDIIGGRTRVRLSDAEG